MKMVPYERPPSEPNTDPDPDATPFSASDLAEVVLSRGLFADTRLGVTAQDALRTWRDTPRSWAISPEYLAGIELDIRGDRLLRCQFRIEALRTTAQGEPPLDEADLARSEHHGRYLRLGETFERVSATLIARHGAPATSRREGLGETAPRDSFPGEVVRLSAEQSWLPRADARLVLRVNDWVDEFFERCGVLATILERT